MFFSPELLARRDSGFGLLWLAATLGSKSIFKKLPKRSILTADISTLCDLIAQPTEPLALRLSSNLMVGVARVYKVKQELFMTDVTNCVTSLKKVVQELKSTALADARLQMAQSSARPSTLTLMADPNSALVMDFDALVANWDEYLNICVGIEGDTKSDSGQSGMNVRKERNKINTLGLHVPHREIVRAEQHTLVEYHEHLLSASFDYSCDTNKDMMDPSSSQVGVAFGLEDNFFAFSDGPDVGTFADELERELGWGVSQTRNENRFTEVDNTNHDLNFDLRSDEGFMFDEPTTLDYGGIPLSSAIEKNQHLKRKTPESLEDEICHLIPLPQLKGTSAPREYSPTAPFSRSPLSQDEQLSTNHAIGHSNSEARTLIYGKRIKRPRLLSDVRIELTDDELKAARTRYVQSQGVLRRTVCLRQAEKEKEKMVDELVWGAPRCIQAPVLAHFWRENYRVQVDARSRSLHLYPRGGALQTASNFGMKSTEKPPKKRQKTKIMPPMHDNKDSEEITSRHGSHFGADKDALIGVEIETDEVQSFGDGEFLGKRIHSSEEPGQGRHASTPLSLLHGYDFNHVQSESQRSSFFPWDNAGGCSSSGTLEIPSSNQTYFTYHADMKLPGNSSSQRKNSLSPSHLESLISGPGSSQASVKKFPRSFDEDYLFEVDPPTTFSVANYSQPSNNPKFVSLERNSFNFLEYAKMQLNSLPLFRSDLDFDIIVPRQASTRHVAAAAFYHCLVLATKDLLHLKQPEAYGLVSISIVA